MTGDNRRGTILVWETDDALAEDAMTALRELAACGAVDGSLVFQSRTNETNDERLWDWLGNLSQGTEVQLVAVACPTLLDGGEERAEIRVENIHAHVRRLTDLLIRQHQHSHQFRLFFYDADTPLRPVQDFYTEQAVNLLVPPLDQQPSHKPRFVSGDAFNWHVASEVATLVGLWNTLPAGHLDPQGGGQEPLVRYARTWARGVCVSATPPQSEGLSLPAPFGFQSVSAPAETLAVQSARVMFSASDLGQLSEEAPPVFEDDEVSVWEALGRAARKMPALFLLGLRSTFSDVTERMAASMAGGQLSDMEQQQAELTSQMQRDNTGLSSADPPDARNSPAGMSSSEWRGISADMFGIADGGGSQPAASARASIGSEKKVLLELPLLVGNERCATKKVTPDGTVGRQAAESKRKASPVKQKQKEDTRRPPTPPPPPPPSRQEAADEPHQQQDKPPPPRNYLDGWLRAHQETLAARRERLAQRRQSLLTVSVQTERERVLTRSAKAVPAVSLMLALFVVLVLSPLHEHLDLSTVLVSLESRVRLFMGFTTVAVWALLFPFARVSSNYLITLVSIGVLGLGAGWVFTSELASLQVIDALGVAVVFIVLALLIVVVIRATALSLGAKNADGRREPSSPWTGEDRVAIWGGGLYFYLLIVATLNSSEYDARDWIDARRGALTFAVSLLPLCLLLLLFCILTFNYVKVEKEALRKRKSKVWQLGELVRQEKALKKMEGLLAMCESALDGWAYTLTFMANRKTSTTDVVSLVGKLPDSGKMAMITGDSFSTLRAGWISERYEAALNAYLEPGGGLSTTKGTSADFARLLQAGAYDEILGEQEAQPVVPHPDWENHLKSIGPDAWREESIPSGRPGGGVKVADTLWQRGGATQGQGFTWHISSRIDVSDPIHLREVIRNES